MQELAFEISTETTCIADGDGFSSTIADVPQNDHRPDRGPRGLSEVRRWT
jgi:hypothetical protein